MIVEVKFIPHSWKKNWLIICVDEEQWKSMPGSYLKQSDLSGQYRSLQEWEETWGNWESKGIKNALIRKLSIKNYFQVELLNVLIEEGFSEDNVRVQLEQFAKNGYLNDEDRLAYQIKRWGNEGKGPRFIRFQLKNKGIECSKETIEIHFPREERRKIILKCLGKSKMDRKKGINSLLRKGFDLEEVLAAKDF